MDQKKTNTNKKKNKETNSTNLFLKPQLKDDLHLIPEGCGRETS